MADQSLFILRTEASLSDEQRQRLRDAFNRVSNLPVIVADGGTVIDYVHVPTRFRFREFLLGAGTGIAVALLLTKVIGLI